ncbi:OmpA family protein [Geomonas sp. Red276]
MRTAMLALLLPILLLVSPPSSAHAFFEEGSMALIPMTGAASFDSNGRSGVSPTGTLKLDWKPRSGEHPAGLNGEAALSVCRLVPSSETRTGENYSFKIGPLWAFTPYRGITPIATASFGLLYGNSNPETKTSLNPFVSFGGGVSFPLNDHVALRAEVSRFQTLEISVASGYEVGVGLSYHFRTPPPAPKQKENTLANSFPEPDRAARAGAERFGEPWPLDSDGFAVVKRPPGDDGNGHPLASGELEAGAGVDGVIAEGITLEEVVRNKPVVAAVTSRPVPAAPRAPRQKRDPAAGGTGTSRSRSFPPNYGEPSLAGLSGVRAVEVMGFPSGSLEIPPSLRPQLKKAVDLTRADPTLRIRIAAHTDASGHPHANYQLSSRRARRIERYLVRDLGADPRTITAKGYGHYQPVVGNDTSAGRALNRRALVIVQEK